MCPPTIPSRVRSARRACLLSNQAPGYRAVRKTGETRLSFLLFLLLMVGMRNLKLTVQYDGTNYVGWQRQATGTSIQGLLEDAFEPIAGTRITVHGAGRTDAGVHALGQVASVSFPAAHEPAVVARALNAVLPTDVRVLSIEDAPAEFHARFSAVGKTYEYRIVNAPIVSPFLVRHVWHVPNRLDTDAMKRASAHLVGTHDFAAFQ